MKTLFLLFFSFAVHAQNTASWIDQQWQLLPRPERATKPAASIPISLEDRRGLDLQNTPVGRNTYLNATYQQLAHDFARCLSVPVASWYQFGYWASRTSGRFMTGERFRQMGPLARTGLALLATLGIVQSEREMIQLFARTNFLIGVEMVPAGKLFLKTYCQGGQLPAYEIFGRHLEGGDRARQELHLAFKQYYLALLESDGKRKSELVAYGTTLQMMGEQRRAQYNVNALFNIGIPGPGPVESIYRWFAASSTGLEIRGGVVIPFNQNVSTRLMDADLASVTLPGYRALHQEHRVATETNLNSFRGTAVRDWGNLTQRLRFLVAVVRGHATRSELLSVEGSL